MKQYYLAHQFKDRKEVRLIQKELEYYYGLNLINPFYDTDRKDVYEIDKGKGTRYAFTDEEARDIVDSDLAWIANSDGVVCILMDRDALGSYMEIFYAAYILGLPVYIICPDEKVLAHIWIRTMAFKLFKSVVEFEIYLSHNAKEMN